ncbi:nitronate monooxygenase [Rhodosalinus halophilus]|uniref:Nitronate monooxygenase n=1 Tax=Rhodosalinus halophilus TaxID=2259333 RepID=A0A365U496_9RHOB|nr:nitronate monooxygenase family protein [Rhodosalinus halophilus]RBI82861.1 nitronate monooxygenase [Rhodosalinus halophilus]
MRPLPPQLSGLRLPAVGAPMFLVSSPELVIAQCTAGIVGSFPALNAREPEGAPAELERWLECITEALAAHDRAHPDRPAAPFAVNLIVHRSNARLERDVEILSRWRVPIWITSLGARPEVFEAARAAGALVLHDVTTDTFARKAIDKGADGLIAVAAGAGGHAGAQSPFALLSEIRAWFDGPLLLSGAISTGRALLAAQAAGADLGYVGSPFIATEEAAAPEPYKRMVVDCGAEDIMSSALFTGVSGNYLRPSIARAGLDPDALPADATEMDFGAGGAKPRAWKEVWGAGQGIGAVRAVRPAAAFVAELAQDYAAARAELEARLARWPG